MLEEKVVRIREWLGSGSINVFGMPMSGKDTVGRRLAEVLRGGFLSSGGILREAENEDRTLNLTKDGQLTPTKQFYEIVLPYFGRENLKGYPLILSMVGRWVGEEGPVMEALAGSGHELKAVLMLDVSEAEVQNRWRAAQALRDRGERADDKQEQILTVRLNEYRGKVQPVIEKYRELGLVVPVEAAGGRDEVFLAAVDAIYRFAIRRAEVNRAGA